MKLGTCPTCGSADVWRSSSRVRHIVRTAFNRGHRYCAACGEKWHVASFVHPPDTGLINRTTALSLISVLLALSLIAAISALAGVNPVRWAKTQVRTWSDTEKGRESKGFLWSVLSIFYSSKDEAKSDYHEHAKE